MRTSFWSLFGILGLVLLVWGPRATHAQGQIEITVPSPERRAPRPEIFIPGQPPDITHPREQESYADGIRVRHDPAFIVPFSTTVSTGPKTVGRFGLAGWTVAQVRGNFPFAHEVPGWIVIGFSFVWDIPVEPEKPGATPPTTTPR